MTNPRLEIDLGAISQNARGLVDALAPKGIGVTGVTKAGLGCPEIARAMLAGGTRRIGDSRVANFGAMRSAGIEASMVLLRSPMLSEVDRVVATTNISLNTESVVIHALAAAARDQCTTHGVMLMVELGDLREGVLEADLFAVVEATLQSQHLALIGLGTNLACQSGVVPSAENMAELSRIATTVEVAFDLELEIVSGGNSANLAWALNASDVGRINDLRLGESILLGRDPLHGGPLPGMRTDGIRLVAEVIESKEKPAQPWGVVGRAAFGDPPSRVGTGSVRQALFAIGRQDVDPDGLGAPRGMQILGASSDHLVVDTGERCCPVGTEVSFELDYSALVRAMTSPFVARVFSDRAHAQS